MPKSKVKAFFTGHEWCTYTQRTHAIIDRALSLGCQEFICFMQPGFDLEVAQILVDRQLPWIALIPFLGWQNYNRRDSGKFRKLWESPTSKQIIMYPHVNGLFPPNRDFARSLQIDWAVKRSEVCLSVCGFGNSIADRVYNNDSAYTAVDRAYHNNLLVVNFAPTHCSDFRYFVRHKQLELFA